MRILSVSGHGCIRATKMNLALMGKGHEVHLVSKRVVPYAINYKSNAVGQDYNQMREAFKLYEPFVDLCHAHNEPSWYVTLWKEISKKPVILDIHDSCLARITPEQWEEQNKVKTGHNIRISTEERNNFQLADGLVYPGRNFQKTVSTEFGLTQPSLCLPSYVPQHFYSYFPLEWQGGLVYEGKVALEKELPMFTYCDYRELGKQAGGMGMDFHLYPAGYTSDIEKFYKDPGLTSTYIHNPVLLEELVRRIGRHDWGLVGNLHPTSEWDNAVPNKLFEYMAAGLPVVVINASECAEFVLEHGTGIVVKNLKELGERWSEHRAVRKNVAKLRMNFTMEKHIGLLEKFYAEVMDKCN